MKKPEGMLPFRFFVSCFLAMLFFAVHISPRGRCATTNYTNDTITTVATIMPTSSCDASIRNKPHE